MKIFLLPSFYLLVFFNIGFILFEFRLIDYLETSPYLYFIVLQVNLLCLMSMIFHRKILVVRRYAGRAMNFSSREKSTSSIYMVFILSFASIAGIYIHSVYLFDQLGGIEAYLLVLANSSHEIRILNGDMGFSVGIQIAYLSWVVVSLISYKLHFENVTKSQSVFLLACFLLVFLGNLTFIDRTRPIWLAWNFFFVSILHTVLFGNLKVLARKMIRLGAGALGIFVLIGLWIGKIEGEGETISGAPQWLESIYIYITGGYAYLNILLSSGGSFLSDGFTRSFYPILMFLSKLGLASSPPSQILDFKNVGGYETNIGTFVEPFLSDGGLILVAIFIVVHTFVFDFIATRCYSKMNFISIFYVSLLIFCNLIAFFVPKFVSVPFYGFTIIYFGYIFLSGFSKVTYAKK